MKTLKKALLLVLAAALLVSAFAGCTGGDSGKKVLKVGTSADYPPYEFHYVEGTEDKIVGFEMEIIRWLGQEMGYDEVEIVDMDFGGILAAIDAGTVDCGMSAFSIDPERLESVDFTDYYYITTQSAMIRTADKDKYADFASLKGQKIGVQTGTVHEKMAADKIENANVVGYTSVPDLILELKAGNVEALVMDTYVAAGYAKQYPELMVAEGDGMSFGEGNVEDSFAVAVKKGNTELTEAFNKAIAKLKETDKIPEWVNAANDLMLKAEQ